MASIIIANGPREGDYYPLGDETVVAGRDAKCPIQVVDERVSRVHLQIRRSPENRSWLASDLKSSNGVIINGRLITRETPLSHGDIIEIGGTKLVFFERDFPNRKSAWDFYKISGERTKGTIIR